MDSRHHAPSLRSVPAWLAAALLATSVLRCSGVASYPLGLSREEALETFPPLARCAARAGLEAVVFSSAVQVKHRAGVVRYDLRPNAFVMDLLPVEGRYQTDNQRSLKALGDRLFACAGALEQTEPTPSARSVIREARHIDSLAAARRTCPKTCTGLRWRGVWWTTVEGRLSVCECFFAAPVGEGRK